MSNQVVYNHRLYRERFAWLEAKQGNLVDGELVTGFAIHEDGRRGVLLLGRDERERVVEFPKHLRSLEARRLAEQQTAHAPP